VRAFAYGLLLVSVVACALLGCWFVLERPWGEPRWRTDAFWSTFVASLAGIVAIAASRVPRRLRGVAVVGVVSALLAGALAIFMIVEGSPPEDVQGRVLSTLTTLAVLPALVGLLVPLPLRGVTRRVRTATLVVGLALGAAILARLWVLEASDALERTMWVGVVLTFAGTVLVHVLWSAASGNRPASAAPPSSLTS
jgi:hypothetical protein